MALLNFDATNVPQNQALDPLPSGWYNAQIVESEIKPTKDGGGAFLALTLEVMDGPFAKRKLFDRLNLQNRNAVAVEIAYKTLSAICHSVNVIQCQDSQQLHGRPMQVKISLRAATTNEAGQSFKATNEVKGYKALENAMAATQQAPSWAAPAQQPPLPQVAPASVAAPAWAPPSVSAPQAFQPPQQQPQSAVSGVAPWASAPPPQATPAPAPQAAPSATPPWQQPQATATAVAPPWAQR